MAIFILPQSVLSFDISSKHNYKFSYYKPNKKVFIKKAKENYLLNSTLKEAYANPEENAMNMFLYAVSMDYIYHDGGDRIKAYYEASMYALDKVYGYLVAPQYFDFLIRTQRYKDVLDMPTRICKRDEPQCIYYQVVAKFLSGMEVSREECQISMKFLPMRNATIEICGEKTNTK